MITTYPLRFLLISLAFIGSGWSNDIIPARPSKQDILLVGGTIHPISHPAIPKGKLLIRQDRIAGLGRESEPLEGEGSALVIRCDGQHIYPGLISANGTLGLVEISAVRATRDLSEPGPFNTSARAEIAVNPGSELLPVARANGILTALTVPQSGGLISGRSALIQLEGWTWEDMVVKAPVGMHLFWPNMRHPSSASSEAIKTQRKNWERQLLQLENFFREARAYQKSKSAKTSQFRSDVRFEAMLPLFEKRLPLFIHALGVVEIQKALQFVDQHDLRAVLVSGQDVWRAAPLLKARGIPVILSTVQSLPLRRWESYDSAMRVPGKLLAAGVPFCIANGSGSSGSSNARNLPYIAAAAVDEDFPPEEALKAMTLYPARILGVEDQLGSLEAGKQATLIVTNGHPLEITTNVLRAFIGGREIDLSSKHTQLFRKYEERQLRLDTQPRSD